MEYLCACTGTVCEGICKSTHLFRKREDLEICPAAYSPSGITRRFEDIDIRERKNKKLRQSKVEVR